MHKTKTVNFSKLAFIYDFIGSICFFGKLHASQKHQLNHYPKRVENVLIIGGGTGKFLLDLSSRLEFDSLTYVDISPKMISLAQEKIQKSAPYLKAKINFMCAPISELPEKKYKLIITHYFLDCFNQKEFELTANRLLEQLSDNGLWSMVDFYNEHSGVTKDLLIRSLYFFFQVSCNLQVNKLPDFDQWFEQSLELKHQQRFLNGLLRASVYKKVKTV